MIVVFLYWSNAFICIISHMYIVQEVYNINSNLQFLHNFFRTYLQTVSQLHLRNLLLNHDSRNGPCQTNSRFRRLDHRITKSCAARRVQSLGFISQNMNNSGAFYSIVCVVNTNFKSHYSFDFWPIPLLGNTIVNIAVTTVKLTNYFSHSWKKSCPLRKPGCLQ